MNPFTETVEIPMLLVVLIPIVCALAGLIKGMFMESKDFEARCVKNGVGSWYTQSGRRYFHLKGASEIEDTAIAAYKLKSRMDELIAFKDSHTDKDADEIT